MAGGKPNRALEKRLRDEYLDSLFAPYQIHRNQKLGDVVSQAPVGIEASEAAAFANRLSYADALVDTNDSVQLWEAKLSANSGAALGQLLVYQHKFNRSPHLSHLHGKPLSLHLVASEIDADAMAVAAQLGIHVHLYRPQWAIDEIASWYGNRSRPMDHAGATVHG